MSYKQDMGEALGDILEAAERYATAQHREFDTHIGEDYVLGPEFAKILSGLHGLLNGETGRLDCGDMSKAIHALARWTNVLDENGELP